MLAYIHTKDGLSIVIDGNQFSVSKEVKNFNDIVAALDKKEKHVVLDLIERNKRMLQKAEADNTGITYRDGVVRWQGEELRGYVVDRLMAFFQAGHDVTPIAKFLGKLQANPSKGVIDNLYQFLEHGQMPLTAEGNFLAYKAIAANWKDIHTGTMDNSIGATPSMPRNRVDDRRDVTCSSGLHVCSFGYLPHFAHANGHVVAVEVDPADVVAVPSDYNNTKMRVSKYRVISEVTDYYKQGSNVLSGDVYEPTYTVMALVDDDSWVLIGEFDDRAEAEMAVEDVVNDGGEGAKVVDAFGTELYKIFR